MQTSLDTNVAVNHISVVHEVLKWLRKSKYSLKASFENVNICY